MDPRLTYIQVLSRESSQGTPRPLTAATDFTDLTDPITIRHSSAMDNRGLLELAELDGRRPLEGPVLVAEIDGRLAAAVAVADGAAVADPFQHTAALVELLQAQAKRERAGRGGRGTFLSRLAARASRPGEARAA